MEICGLQCQQACTFETLLYKINESNPTMVSWGLGPCATGLPQWAGFAGEDICGKESVLRGSGRVRPAQRGQRRALGVTLASPEMLAPFRDTTLISGDGRPGLVRAGPEDASSVRLVTTGIGVSMLLVVNIGSQ